MADPPPLIAAYLRKRADLVRFFTLRTGSAEAAEDVVVAWQQLDPDTRSLLSSQLRTLNLVVRVRLLAEALVARRLTRRSSRSAP